jgi:gliding motility-associated-like protein
VVKEGSWNIPNVFTPNGDGVNDTWNITSKTTEQAQVKVLNRWGSVVYESEKYANDWEANNMPDGIYFYQITQNEGCQYKGWVQVLR